MSKFNFKQIFSVTAGATGGAYAADYVNDMITDKVDDDKTEIAVKAVATLAAGYMAGKSKGIMQFAAIAATGQFGKGVIESAKEMSGGSGGGKKPTRGIADEIAGIHDEIERAYNMRGNDDMGEMEGNDPIINGNEPVINGNDPIINGNEMEGYDD